MLLVNSFHYPHKICIYWMNWYLSRGYPEVIKGELNIVICGLNSRDLTERYVSPIRVSLEEKCPLIRVSPEESF